MARFYRVHRLSAARHVLIEQPGLLALPKPQTQVKQADPLVVTVLISDDTYIYKLDLTSDEVRAFVMGLQLSLGE